MSTLFVNMEQSVPGIILLHTFDESKFGSKIYDTCGGFQAIGLPPNHPFDARMFHYKPSSYEGTPIPAFMVIPSSYVHFIGGISLWNF